MPLPFLLVCVLCVYLVCCARLFVHRWGRRGPDYVSKWVHYMRPFGLAADGLQLRLSWTHIICRSSQLSLTV
jgi:hypothetical protein